MNTQPLCGWIPPEDRTPEEQQVHTALVAAMPEFNIFGSWQDKDKVLLWEFSKAYYGKHLPCFHQSTGSCVGQGKAIVEWYLQCVQAVASAGRETVVMPYEPYGYAQSRVCAGISGRQAGSTGSGAAEAAKKYGVLRSDLQGLPAWKEQGRTVYWPASVDDQWGMRGAPQEWVTEGSKKVVKTTSQLRSIEDAVAALSNYYPITIASNWGGTMKPPVKGGSNPVLLNRRSDTWMHQMAVLSYQRHPELGLLFYIQNSWGEDAHGTPPDDSPPGGFWVGERDMADIISQREAFAYSQFDGFPAQEIDPALFNIFKRP